MLSIKKIKEVEKNDEDGGYLKVEIIEDDVKRFVMLGYDFGDSLVGVEIIDEDDNFIMNEEMEDVFSEKVIDICWGYKIFNYIDNDYKEIN